MKKYFRVIKTFPRKLPDHHFYGFEKESDFAAALVELHGKYAGHLGLCVTERDATCELKISESGQTTKVWFPRFMLRRVPPPQSETDDYWQRQIDEKLDRILWPD